MKKTEIFCIFMLSLCVGIVMTYSDLSIFSDTVVYAPLNEDICFQIPSCGGVKDGIVNINTANIDELTQLRGIGDKYAERIITYRQKYGRFEVIQDIMKVPGIGENRFADIRDKITVE